MKRLRAGILHALVALLMALPAVATVSNISGFITQIDGDTITAAEWNTFVGGIYTYINGTLVAEFNKLATKGGLLTYNGTAITQLSNAGAGDDGKVLELRSTEASGLRWVAPAGVGLTTTGDMLYYNGANTRLPIGTAGQVLTVSGGLPVWASNSSSFTAGMIMMWSGSIASIPSGWALCDGQSGRPNLQGMFIIGAGDVSPAASGGFGLKAPGTTGGSTTHTHSVTVTGASTAAPSATALVAAGATASVASSAHTHTVNSTTVTSAGCTAEQQAPKYYALAYIIKLFLMIFPARPRRRSCLTSR